MHGGVAFAHTESPMFIIELLGGHVEVPKTLGVHAIAPKGAEFLKIVFVAIDVVLINQQLLVGTKADAGAAFRADKGSAAIPFRRLADKVNRAEIEELG